MKNIPEFEDFIRENASEAFLYHMDRGLGITESIFRIGSDAYDKLFEETKEWWDKGNVILNGKEGWMAKNLKVGKKAKFETEDGKWMDVKLDTPTRQNGGEKKFKVYHDSGKVDEDGNIIAMAIGWGQPGVDIKNDDPGAAASYWARQQCDLKKSMDPTTPKFWACYAPSLFTKQIGLSSDNPW
jgi:hypothetical protein